MITTIGLSLIGLVALYLTVQTICILSLPLLFSGFAPLSQHLKFCWMIWWRTMIDSLFTIVSTPVAVLGLLIERDRTLEHRNLPRWLMWFDNYKDPLGDVYWQGPEHANGHQKEFLWRLRWLMRNPVNNWGYYILGWTIPSFVSYRMEGDLETSDQPIGKSGKVMVIADKKIPCYYLVQQYWKLPLCFRLYYGWKIKGVSCASDQPFAQFAAAPSPLKNFKIKE
jgi:hypothetical protein